MRVLIIGGTGTIGSQVAKYFRKNHDVITAGSSTGDLQVDIGDSASITAMYHSLGSIDAVTCIAGEAKWAPFESLSEADFYLGIQNKLMGQVNLVRLGKDVLSPGGVFTLTSGILADDPVQETVSPSLVNGAIHSFVLAVSRELKHGQRINVISSGLVEDSVEKYQAYFPGHNPVPMTRVVNAYAKSVLSGITGKIIRVYN